MSNDERGHDGKEFMTQGRRTLYLFLCLATAGCVLWTIFMASVFVIGPVDVVHIQLKPRLIEELGDQGGRELVSDISGLLAHWIQRAVLYQAAPLLVVLFAWMWIAIRAMNRCVQLESKLRGDDTP